MQYCDAAYMLKRDPRGKFMYREVGIFHKKRLWRFYTSKMRTEGELEEQSYLDILEQQKSYPVAIMRDGSSKKQWWMFKDEFYWEDADLLPFLVPSQTRVASDCWVDNAAICAGVR
jgi:hypothetical protein